jgi:transposase-like protein
MPPLTYAGYRFPRDIIQRAVWMYLRFTPSFRDVEELLAERGITASYESGGMPTGYDVHPPSTSP